MSVLLLWPSTRHHAVANPEPNLEVTLSIWAMQVSIHSDWQREIVVLYKGERIAMRLFEDTGWWRGSNLYQHVSGTYILHEGQSGCISFTIEPLMFVDTPESACIKTLVSVPDSSNHSSLYYQNMLYLGHFLGVVEIT